MSPVIASAVIVAVHRHHHHLERRGKRHAPAIILRQPRFIRRRAVWSSVRRQAGKEQVVPTPS
jgi:hypothetical protein